MKIRQNSMHNLLRNLNHPIQWGSIRGINRVDSRPSSSTTIYNHRERETVCATTSYKCTTHRNVTEDQNPESRLPLFADFPSSNNEPQMCSTLTVSQKHVCSKLTVYIYTFSSRPMLNVGLC